MAPETVTLDVFRYRPEEAAEPTFDRYQVPFHDHWQILDALTYVKDQLDGTLSFRWSCRMGICGSCGMMVNGKPILTCSTMLRDYADAPIRIEPLAYFPVIRDLVIDWDDFLEKLTASKAWLISGEGDAERQHRQTPAELERFRQFSMCINCMLCYSACPVYGLEPEFLGPAAIALARRYDLDSRDAGEDQRRDVLFGSKGAYACTFVGECSRVCPKHVDPAGAIQQAKLAGAKAWARSLLIPWGKK
jgi:fumarate reductase iron-sulfur subunit